MKRKNKIKSTVNNLDKPVLAAPNLDKKMKMKVNISDYAIRGILLIEYEDGQWKLIAFLL